eukprot:6640701-Prymnesium_polylepis.1
MAARRRPHRHRHRHRGRRHRHRDRPAAAAVEADMATSGSSRRCMVAGTENKWTVSSRSHL